MAELKKPFRIVYLEDNLLDAELIKLELEKAGIDHSIKCVENREAFIGAIQSFHPDLILSDFSLPGFDGLSALALANSLVPETPFIFVSGTIGEERAIEALKQGATDYVVKDRPARLGASVLRALHEAEERLQRRLTEEQLEGNRELFRLITENVVDLIVVLDPQGRRLYSSPSYASILGEPSLRQGEDSFQEIHPDDRERVKGVFRETVSSGVGRRTEYRFVTRGGEVRFIESHGSVIKGNAGNVIKVVVVSRDVTERKHAEIERNRLEAQFRQAQKMESIGTLAGGVAHDFNNILGIILGYGSLLATEVLTDERAGPAIAAINNAAHRGSALVRQLMTFARKSGSVLEPVDVNALITELVGMLTATFPKSIEFSLTLDPKLSALSGDGGQLNQALLNLCVNARDAMPHGGTLSIRTSLMSDSEVTRKFGAGRAARYVVLEVQDTGTGMDEETRSRIFEPFFTTKGLTQGTGLGLAVVYGVVKGHGGFIDVESAPGKGATFRIVLPMQPAASSVRQGEGVPVEMPRGHETILFVEDEELLVEIVTIILTDHGYRVMVARSGPEAIETFRTHAGEIDLIVSDLGLPGMGGWEAFMRIREIDPGIQALFATGFIEEGMKSEMLAKGVSQIIQKPYVVGEILRAIRSALDTSSGKRIQK